MKNSANKKISELPQYYNRFDESHGFDETLFLAGRGLQSAELNELQSAGMSRIQGIGDALFQEGDVISGAACVIDGETGEATIESGKIYLQGAVRSVDAAQLTIPLTGAVQLGVCLQTSIVTELDDPILRDPALGCRNYQEAGAARLRRTTAWTYEVIDALELADDLRGVNDSENPHNPQETNNAPSKNNGSENNPNDKTHLNDNDEHTAHFYPIYRVVNGVLAQHSAPSQSDAFEKRLARYDYEPHGHYVIEGLTVQCQQPLSNDGVQRVILNEGSAHINGFEVRIPLPVRYEFPLDPDVAAVKAEAHPFSDQVGGLATITLRHFPVAKIQCVEATVQRTLTVQHGQSADATDRLPEEVLGVLGVAQARLGSYQAEKDYRFEKGQIDWSLGGKTPAPGSTYGVLCQLRTVVSPVSVNEQGFTLYDAVEGSEVLVDYTWYLPRVDVLTLNRAGVLQRLRGEPVNASDSVSLGVDQPVAPVVPPNLLVLAHIRQTWSGQLPPQLVNIAVRSVPLSAFSALQASVQGLCAEVAALRLCNAVNAFLPAVKKAVLVDTFLNNAQRDADEPQCAVILNGCLTLPIAENTVTVSQVDDGSAVFDAPDAYLLPYEWAICLEQPVKTHSVVLNANGMRAGKAMPVCLKLFPALDRWPTLPATLPDACVRDFWSQRFSVAYEGFQFSVQRLSQDALQTAITQVRPQLQTLWVSGCSPAERVTVCIDGEPVKTLPAVLMSNAKGEVVGQFTWPASLPSGLRRVACRGNRGGYADTLFFSREAVGVNERQSLSRAIDADHPEDLAVPVDALAQTFTLPQGRHVGGVELWIESDGNFPLLVQLREVREGKIAAGIFAQVVVKADQLRPAGEATRITWSPVWLAAQREYAVVLNGGGDRCRIAVAANKATNTKVWTLDRNEPLLDL